MRRMITGKQVEALENLDKKIAFNEDDVKITVPYESEGDEIYFVFGDPEAEGKPGIYFDDNALGYENFSLGSYNADDDQYKEIVTITPSGLAIPSLGLETSENNDILDNLKITSIQLGNGALQLCNHIKFSNIVIADNMDNPTFNIEAPLEIEVWNGLSLDGKYTYGVMRAMTQRWPNNVLSALNEASPTTIALGGYNEDNFSPIIVSNIKAINIGTSYATNMNRYISNNDGTFSLATSYDPLASGQYSIRVLLEINDNTKPINFSEY